MSGKVIAAVAQSRAAQKVALTSDAVKEIKNTEVVPVPMPTGDLKDRFRLRKEELETQRHASDPMNVRRSEKRRAAEEKKKKRQQKRLVDGPTKDTITSSNDSSKKVKTSESVSGKVLEEGSFVFNRLDETDGARQKPAKKAISDPKQALQKLQAQKSKLEKLKATDSDKAEALEEKLRVKKALQKAEGISIKDDVGLLKKSIQRRDKEKEKSRKVWTDKKQDQKEHTDKRQAKRTENIQSRIDAKKNKKMGLKVKKPQGGAKGGKAGFKGKNNKSDGKFKKTGKKN